jgi:hypothetical protein
MGTLRMSGTLRANVACADAPLRASHAEHNGPLASLFHAADPIRLAQVHR